jgi:purine-binding chemotaxis protein CheW
MGRMADARKRARQKERPKAEEAKAPAASERAPRSPDPAPEPALTSIPLTAPLPSPLVVTDPPARAVLQAPSVEHPTGRIELPSSGLAADILARHEALEVAVAAPLASIMAPVPASAPAAGGAQSMSFFAVPVQEERAAAEATEHLATFSLDREEYGVEVRLVQEIRRVADITPVPRAPEFIRGVINLRGRILPVVDLKKKLGLGEVLTTKASRIVVVRIKDRLLGLLVDGASQVLKVPVSRIEPPPDEVSDKGGDTIRGVAKLEDRLVILLDLQKVLAHEFREGTADR